jgi:hypothetical protein
MFLYRMVQCRSERHPAVADLAAAAVAAEEVSYERGASMKAEITIAGNVLRLSPLATPSVVSEIIDLNAAFLADLTRLRLGQDAIEAMGQTMDNIRAFMTKLLLLSIRELQPDYSGDDLATLSSADLCRTVRRILLLTDKKAEDPCSSAIH